ncbi:energy transducer TonB [Hymenobacter cellulosivorans]|uniref:Energy transducer TonB n=1 Tax=Hymenobacter cellulosivorans TaxID=2932249 RepID=A0ABY4FGP3_9BACT|nr:energy transducer TonB [Hymenobacter cellulosivorans]UOQ55580.1 energy transducer TonB [Hymenobacter cellulosivorans]
MLRFLPLFLWILLPVGPAIAQSQLTAALTDSGTAPSAASSSAPAVPVIYHTAEEMPSFPGGEAAFTKFLRAKIQYPTTALNHGTSGKVHVSFVVDEQGHILDPKVVKGLGFGLDEEALRLVRIMPWWNPGKIGGQPVKVAYTLPIVFRALE